MDYKCVECGSGIKTLYIQYSPGNIRLMKCENCKAVADQYVECEFMILLIDLILLKPKAYRHLLHNMLQQETIDSQGLLWKSAMAFLVLDGYRSLILSIAKDGWNLSSFVWRSGKVLVDVFLGNFIFFLVFLLMMRTSIITSAESLRYKDLILATLISSYFKFFLIAMMIWEFPPSMVYITDAFVLSSNVVALRVITRSTTERCIGACFAAHSAKFIASEFWNWNYD